MKVGVIGTGFGKRVVAPAFQTVSGVEVAGVVSPRDAEAVRKLCQRKDVDLVSIHSPPALHRAHIALAAEAGKAVLCDKPLGVDAAEARACRDVAEQAGVRHFLNVEFRASPTREKMRELAKSGAIGRVEHAFFSQHSAGARLPMRAYGWLFDATRGGGWIGAWAPHAVDFLRWTVGEVLDASGARRLTVKERVDRQGKTQRCTAEDGLSAVLRLEGGASATLDSGFAASTPVPQRVALLGSEGSLFEENNELVLARGKQREVVAKMETTPDVHDIPMRRYAARICEVLRESAGHELPTLDDGAAIARVLDRLRALPLLSS
jgi:predicted dehydrogenase